MGLFSFLGDLVGKSEQDQALEDAQQRYSQMGYNLSKIPGYEYIEGSSPLMYSMPEEMQAQTISEDPTLRAAEVAALQNLKARAEEGMTTADTADWMANQRRAATEARGQEEALIDAMSRRGMGGGGTEYALRMGANQSALDRLAENEAQRAASNAELKALSELKSGELAGQMRGEDFNVASSNADILNKFTQANSLARQQAQQNNIALQNAYAQNELEEKRNINKGNIDLALNKQKTLAGIANQQNQAGLAGAIGKSNLYSNIGKTAGDVLNTVTSDDKNKKWSIW